MSKAPDGLGLDMSGTAWRDRICRSVSEERGVTICESTEPSPRWLDVLHLALPARIAGFVLSCFALLAQELIYVALCWRVVLRVWRRGHLWERAVHGGTRWFGVLV